MLNMGIEYSHQNTKPGNLWTLISAKVKTVLWLGSILVLLALIKWTLLHLLCKEQSVF